MSLPGLSKDLLALADAGGGRVSAAPRRRDPPAELWGGSGPAPSEGPQAWLLTLTHGRLEDQLPLLGLGEIPSSEEESRLRDVFEPAHLRHLQVDLLLFAKALGNLLVLHVQSLCKAPGGGGWPSGVIFPGDPAPTRSPP